MARLPQPGRDNGVWGDILNDYLSQTLKMDGTLKDNSVGAAQLQDNAVNETSIADGSITETLLDSGVTTKLNQATPTWSTIAGKPAVIAEGADAVAARSAINALGSADVTAAIGASTTSQAVTAASLGAHIWVNVTTNIYQRDGADVGAASVLTHNTASTRPYIELFPDTTNDIHLSSGGSEGVIGSGGALPSGWTLLNPSNVSVSVEHMSVDGSFDVELMATIPPSGYIGYSSPDISSATSTRHISFNFTAAATDLEYFQTQVGWVIGTANSQIWGGGGGQITTEIVGSSASTDKMQWLFKNTNTAASITIRVLVKNVAVYAPSTTGGLRKNIQPVAFDTQTLYSRDATVYVAAGDYFVFAWTEGRGIVCERVTVTGSSFSLRTVIGNGRVSKLAVWKAANYINGALDVLEPPRWETVDEFDTGHLEMMSNQITSHAKMRYQAPGNSWNVQVATNRFLRSRIEIRPGEYMVIDTVAPVNYAHTYQRRAEVYSGFSYPYDTDIWTSFSMRTDTMLSDPNSYGLIWQWLDTASASDTIRVGPSLNLQLRQNGQLGLYTASTTDPNPPTTPAAVLQWLGRFNVGEWNHIVIRAQFSQSGGGKLGFWLNGVEVYPYQDTAVGMNKPYGVQPHYGFYGGQSRDTIRIDRANVEFGTTDLSSRITNPLPI